VRPRGACQAARAGLWTCRLVRCKSSKAGITGQAQGGVIRVSCRSQTEEHAGALARLQRLGEPVPLSPADGVVRPHRARPRTSCAALLPRRRLKSPSNRVPPAPAVDDVLRCCPRKRELRGAIARGRSRQGFFLLTAAAARRRHSRTRPRRRRVRMQPRAPRTSGECRVRSRPSLDASAMTLARVRSAIRLPRARVP